MAVKSVVQSRRERLRGTVVLAAIVLVQVLWGAVLIYLLVRFI